MKTMLILAFLLVTVCGLGSVGIVLDGTGWIDMDDDLWEILLVVNNAGPGGYFEVWGYGSISGISENTIPKSAIELKPNSPNPYNSSCRGTRGRAENCFC